VDVRTGEVLWEPDQDAISSTRMGRFLRRASRTSGRELADYQDLWQWSVDDLESFWQLLADEFDVVWDTAPDRLLADATMPHATWAPGAELNYARHALRGDGPAVVAHGQTRDRRELGYDELREQVARCRTGLQRLGVGRGDRVVAYLPNIPETIVAFLATASLGAIWSSCAPEFGVEAVVDRVTQIEPKVLLTVDGYRYGTKEVDRREQVQAIRDALPSLQATVLLPYLDRSATLPDAVAWDDLLAEQGELAFEAVPFDHPLYVLYSSGTTGKPKPIVHGHGGILLEHCKVLGLHHDLGPGDRFSWFTTTGWMMWNYLVSGLLVESTVVLFDGDPGHPDLRTLWRVAADESLDVLGVSAPFLLACRKQDLRPGDEFDLTGLEQVGSTGAPLPPEGFGWVTEAVGEHVQVVSASGGTDVCTAFVAGAPLVPVRAGEIPCRCLGCDVQAWAPDRTELVGERGELVITQPMPSMPVGFWGDDDGSRYREAYFDTFGDVWRHGDWLTVTEHGSCIITGRSDATLNRGGVRMGTAEFYSAVDELDWVAASLVVHLEERDGAGDLVLFVAPVEGEELDERRRHELASVLRERLSPRHVPDEMHEVGDVPRTLSGKKLEIPVKRLLQGEALDDVAAEGALANPECLHEYVRTAERRGG
jgi:acetoacetyl-CoA synthetase